MIVMMSLKSGFLFFLVGEEESVDEESESSLLAETFRFLLFFFLFGTLLEIIASYLPKNLSPHSGLFLD